MGSATASVEIGRRSRRFRRYSIGLATAAIALMSTLAVASPATADSVTTTIAGAGGTTNGSSVAVTADGSRIYVARGAATPIGISVIDTSTNTATTIPTALAPTSVVVSPDGTRLYATLGSVNQVAVIDTATGNTIATVAVGALPSGIAISPDGSRVYSANVNSGGSISAIDTATNAVTTFSVPAARNLIVSPDGSRLYVGLFSGTAHNVLVFDTTTNTLVTTIVTPGSTTTGAVMGFAFSTDGTRLYGNTRGNGTVIIDTATNTVVGTIPTGTNNVTSGGIAVTPDGTRAYATNSTSGTVSVIDLATNSVTDTIAVGTGPGSIRITPDGLHAYVNNSLAASVSVIALDTFPAITTTTLPGGTTGAGYAASIATAGSPAPQVTVTSGALPPGLSLDPTTGALTGTPTTAGSFTFTVTAASTVSGIAATATRAYTLVITAVSASGVDSSGGTDAAVLANSGVDQSAGFGAAAALTILGLGLLVARRFTGRRRGRSDSAVQS